MSQSEDTNTLPEVEPTAEQRQLSRRTMVRAGLVVVPILMSLPVVPAWAFAAKSCETHGHWSIAESAANPATRSIHHGCRPSGSPGGPNPKEGQGGMTANPGGLEASPLSTELSPFQSPFK